MEQVAKLKRTWNLAPVLQIVQKITENCCSYLYISVGQIWSCGSKDIFKNAPSLMCRYSSWRHRFGRHGIVKNTKTWISWERNITFLRNKKIHNLCHRWHIFRSYRFAVEVTFKHLRRRFFPKIITLREKSPNKEFFYGPYFPAFGLNAKRYYVFGLNTERYIFSRCDQICRKLRIWSHLLKEVFNVKIDFILFLLCFQSREIYPNLVNMTGTRYL